MPHTRYDNKSCFAVSYAYAPFCDRSKALGVDPSECGSNKQATLMGAQCERPLHPSVLPFPTENFIVLPHKVARPRQYVRDISVFHNWQNFFLLRFYSNFRVRHFRLYHSHTSHFCAPNQGTVFFLATPLCPPGITFFTAWTIKSCLLFFRHP